MRRIIALALLLALLPAASLAAGTRLRVSVYARLISNDHVGSDWILDVDLAALLSLPGLDPGRLPASGWVTLTSGATLTVTAKITEDEKHPDIAEDTISRKLTASDLRSGFDIVIPLTVIEDNGRYKGKKAEWEITVSFRP